jgi:hypothetical protein
MTPAERKVAINLRVIGLRLLAIDTALAYCHLRAPARREQFALALGADVVMHSRAEPSVPSPDTQ